MTPEPTAVADPFDAELTAAEARLGVTFPEAYRAFARIHAGHAAASEGDEGIELGGLWLPPVYLGGALDFDLADFAVLAEEPDEALDRLMVIRLSEDGAGFVTLDYRTSDTPEVRFFLHEEDDAEAQLVFDTFEAFEAALAADPIWARPLLAHDPLLASRMLGDGSAS